MRCTFLAILLMLCGTPAWGIEEPIKPQVAAAVASAVEHLQADVEAEPILPGLTVEVFLARTNSATRLRAVLEQSQQIGGPRWIDPQTCQVRLDISGGIVRRELQRIALENPQATPIAPDELNRALHGWEQRYFSATGMSTDGADQLRPPRAVMSWTGAKEEEIRLAVGLARQDAARRVLDSIGAIAVKRGKSIHDLLSDPIVARAVFQWLQNRPMMRVDFKEDREVEVTLSVSAGGLSEALRQSALAVRANRGSTQPNTINPMAIDDADWRQVEGDISLKMARAIGRGRTATTQPVIAVSLLPSDPLEWVDHQLDGGASGLGPSPLLSARAAEAGAMANLRSQVAALPIGNGKVLGDAASRDPQLAAAIERAVIRDARLYRVEYHPDGSAAVRMSLNLRDLWQAIAPPP